MSLSDDKYTVQMFEQVGNDDVDINRAVMGNGNMPPPPRAAPAPAPQQAPQQAVPVRSECFVKHGSDWLICL